MCDIARSRPRLCLHLVNPSDSLDITREGAYTCTSHAKKAKRPRRKTWEPSPPSARTSRPSRPTIPPRRAAL
ncbi:hypothetical protein COLSTE_00950 [Collinsella stercoris DSM 13279]|uniref:Uncharacterized protein n=1 Tax=Collinsella stercoris DSM 13279 TaxID=445975 RepID=B6GA54_9ACTN|nr:hypothetical protein COLSTE_00950 [Collinsella stercoris DSM 13279]